MAKGSALCSRKTPFPMVQALVWCLLGLRSDKLWSPEPNAPLATAALAIASTGHVHSKRTAKQKPGNSWKLSVPGQDFTPGVPPARPARAPLAIQTSQASLERL